jgi:nicotinate-nucleotide adenylyltransferase
MVELACGDALDDRFEPSRLEAGQEQSYSIVTVRKVRPLAKDLYFIIGADAFAEITSWYCWQELLQLMEFIVVTRPGHQYECPPGARVHRLDTLALPASSSEIRQQLAAGKVPAELPPSVAQFIVQNGLYQFSRIAGSTRAGF